MSATGSQVRRTVAALAMAGAVGTVVHLVGSWKDLQGGVLFGLWVSSPLWAFGVTQTLLARRPAPPADGPGRLAGLVAATLALLLVVVGSQVVVRTNRASTAALLYLFAPVYGAVLGVLSWLAGWGGGAWLARRRPSGRPEP